MGRTGEQSIHRVFVDPGGSHCISTVVGNGGSESFYMHAKWSKPRVLGRLKGLTVNAVAWNRQLITEGKEFWNVSSMYQGGAQCDLPFLCFSLCALLHAASTREIILGMDNGQLYEMAVDEKDKREKYIKFLFELSELPEAFTGLQVHILLFLSIMVIS